MSQINSKKIIIAALGTILCCIIFGSILLLYASSVNQPEIKTTAEIESIAEPIREHTDYTAQADFPNLPYREAGYENIKVYWEQLLELRAEAEGKADAAIAELDGWILDEEKELLVKYEENMRTADNIETYNESSEAFDDLVKGINIRIADYTPPQIIYDVSYSTAAPVINSNIPSDGNTFESQGVVNWNGTRYTYYSSNSLYHYKTPEWTPNSEGFYTDSNGYLICASSDHPQGAIVDTPWGQGVVQDTGCASGTLDMYTNF